MLVLAVWAFWTMRPVLGVLLSLGLILIAERSLHSAYIFHDDVLIIDHGRLAKRKIIPIDFINCCTPMSATFGLVHYLLISYGTAGKVEAVQPVDEKAFVDYLERKRRETETHDD